ncbi:MAG: aminoglycoside phosphotransferase family protein [Saccharofermentanales bacterium]
MSNQIERDNEYISRLADFICDEYGIAAISIIPAKRGYYGETWRINTENGNYFIKLDYSPRHQIKYRNSMEVVEYLCDNGIDFISRIIKTKAGDLFSIFDSAVLGVFVWVDGENIETDETKIPEYEMLSKIYPLTKQGFEIPSIEFSNERALKFFTKWEQLKTETPSDDNKAILAIFEQHKNALEHYAARLSYFSNICQKDKSHFYITHGDAGGNLLVGNGNYNIIDWDEVMYAPLERDAWFMCCCDWALKAFTDALNRNNISYMLRPERLAFYCYHMFFLYLGEFLDDFTQCGKMKEIEDYFSCWIMERMKYADTTKIDENAK